MAALPAEGQREALIDALGLVPEQHESGRGRVLSLPLVSCLLAGASASTGPLAWSRRRCKCEADGPAPFGTPCANPGGDEALASGVLVGVVGVVVVPEAPDHQRAHASRDAHNVR